MSLNRITAKNRIAEASPSNPSTDKSPATVQEVNTVIDAVNTILDGTAVITEVEVSNGTAAEPSITFDADNDTGLYRSAANAVGFTANGAQVGGFGTSGIIADTIVEMTAAAGVTADGVLLKDSSIALADGLVSNLSLKLGADKNNGIYGVSDVQIGIAVEGVLVGGADANGLFTSTISEQVATVGVTIDGVLCKDGGVTANSMYATFMPTAAVQALSGPGAVNVTSYSTKFTSTGTGDALTLAAGTQIGQIKKISYVAEAAGGDTGVLTLTGYTSITFNAIGDYAELLWNGSAWFVVDYVGVTIV